MAGELQEYSVTLSSAVHGRVVADADTAQQGAVVTVEAFPDEGYECEDVFVVDAQGGPVAFDGTFSMPASDVTVTGVFSKEQEGTYSLVATAEGNGEGSVSGTAGAFAEGHHASISATAADGSRLAVINAISRGASIASSAESPLEFDMPAAAVLVLAYFERLEDAPGSDPHVPEDAPDVPVVPDVPVDDADENDTTQDAVAAGEKSSGDPDPDTVVSDEAVVDEAEGKDTGEVPAPGAALPATPDADDASEAPGKEPPAPTEYQTAIHMVSEQVLDFSPESLAAYEASGALALVRYDDGTSEFVDWSDVPTPFVGFDTFDIGAAAREEASALVSEVHAAVEAAIARLDAQAGLIDGLDAEVDEFKQTAAATYSTKTEVDEATGAVTREMQANYATKAENMASTHPNLSPFYANALDDVKGASNPDGYWGLSLDRAANPKVESKGGGWVHVYWDNSGGSAAVRFDHDVKALGKVKPGTDYTFLFEVRNNASTGTVSSNGFYIVQCNNMEFWGAGVKKVLGGSNSQAAVNVKHVGETAEQRVVKTSEADGSSHWTGDLTGMLRLVFLASKGDVLDFELRVSMYEGEYTGAYKPYVQPLTDVSYAVKHHVTEAVDEYDRTIEATYLKQADAQTTYTSKTDFNQTTSAISLTAEKALKTARDADANMLLDWNAPSLANVDWRAGRYWSDAGNTMVVPSFFAVADPPEPSVENGARLVCDGTQTAAVSRALAFYTGTKADGVPYIPGQSYTVTWWARCTSGEAETRLVYRDLNPAAGATAGKSVLRPLYELTPEWRQFSETFAATGEPQDYSRLWFYARFEPNQAGTVEMCGFRMVPGISAEAVDGKLSNYTQRSEFSVAPDQIASTVADALTSAKGYTDARETAIKQYADNITLSAEARTSNCPNLTPWHSQPLSDKRDATTNPNGYWHTVDGWGEVVSSTEGKDQCVPLDDGWAEITLDARSESGNQNKTIFLNQWVAKDALRVKESTSYTWLVEVDVLEWNGVGDAYSKPSVGNATMDKLGDVGTSLNIKNGGVFRKAVMSKADFSSLTLDTRGFFYATAGCYIKFRARVSLYESPVIDGTATTYQGPYKPYVPDPASLYEAHAAIKVNQTNIQTEVEARKEAIANVQVGGRNLLLGTSASKTITVPSSLDGYTGYWNESDYGKTVTNGNTTDEFCISFDWIATGATGAFWAQVDGNIIANIVSSDGGIDGSPNYIDPSSGSGHYWAVFRFNATQAGKAQQRVRFRNGNLRSMTPTEGSTITISNLKLEQGNKPTDWSPAPEDTASAVSSVSSRVTQTETDITRLFANSSAGLDIKYHSHTSATSAPGDTVAWSDAMPARADGKYVWMWVRKYEYNASHEKTLTTSTKTCISGADGKDGANGTNGTNGTNGGRWYSGTGITGTSTTATVFGGSGVSSAVVGDMYLNTSTWNTYRCTVAGAASAAKWVYVSNIKGAKGDTGATGAKGDQGDKGDKGDKGDQGDPGADGSMIKVVVATAVGTAAKTTGTSGSSYTAVPTLEDGTVIQCMFSPANTEPGKIAHTNTSTGATLKVGTAAAKPLVAFDQQISNKSLYRLKTGVFITLVYSTSASYYAYASSAYGAEKTTGGAWIVADAAAMVAYARENDSGLAVGTNYNYGYSQVLNGGGFKVMKKATQTAAENPTGDTSLAELLDGTLQLGKFASPHLYMNSSSFGFYPASSNTANDAYTYIDSGTVRLGQRLSGKKNLVVSNDGILMCQGDRVAGRFEFFPDSGDDFDIGPDMAVAADGMDIMKISPEKFSGASWAALSVESENVSMSTGRSPSMGYYSGFASSSWGASAMWSGDTVLDIDASSRTVDIKLAQSAPSGQTASLKLNGVAVSVSGHKHGAEAINSGTLDVARLPVVTVAKGGTGIATSTTPNRVFATAASGTTATAPSWRALVAADLPTVTVAKGGTGATNANAAKRNLGMAKTAGDSITGIYWYGGGFITNAKKDGRFTVPLGVQLYGVSTVGIAGTVQLRGNGYYLWGSGGGDELQFNADGTTNVSGVTYTAWANAIGLLHVTVKGGEQGAMTNNAAIGVMLSNVTISFT